MKEIDEYDKKLIMLLQHNATLPVSQIAKQLHISKERTAYRMHRLEEQGIIAKYGSVVNREPWGFTDVYLLLKTKNCTAQKRQEFEQFFIHSKYVKWANYIFGQWDYYLVVTVQNMNQLNDLMYALENEFIGYIADTDIFPIYTFVDWKPLPLTKQKISDSAIKQIAYVEQKFDHMDVNIMQHLADNARTTNVFLSQKLNITQKTVIERKKRLLRNGVLIGTFCSVNEQMLGLNNYKVLVKLKDISSTTINMIKEAIHQQSHIVYADIILGAWQCRFDVVVSDIHALNKILVSLENKLGDIFESHTVLQTLSEFKRTSFPEIIREAIV